MEPSLMNADTLYSMIYSPREGESGNLTANCISIGIHVSSESRDFQLVLKLYPHYCIRKTQKFAPNNLRSPIIGTSFWTGFLKDIIQWWGTWGHDVRRESTATAESEWWGLSRTASRPRSTCLTAPIVIDRPSCLPLSNPPTCLLSLW